MLEVQIRSRFDFQHVQLTAQPLEFLAVSNLSHTNRGARPRDYKIMDGAGIPVIQRTVGSSYRDYSRLTPAEAQQIWGQERALAGGTQFPTKLYDMLVQAEPDMNHIVSWQPHGRSFLIHNKVLFVAQILPA